MADFLEAVAEFLWWRPIPLWVYIAVSVWALLNLKGGMMKTKADAYAEGFKAGREAAITEVIATHEKVLRASGLLGKASAIGDQLEQDISNALHAAPQTASSSDQAPPP